MCSWLAVARAQLLVIERKTSFLAAPQEAGTATYCLSGHGTRPDTQQPVKCVALVCGTSIQTVCFKNPFTEEVVVMAVDISDVPDLSNSRVLELAGAVTLPAHVQAGSSLDIPLRFSPRSMSNAFCMLTLHVSCSYSQEPLLFKFPVIGTADIDAVGALVNVNGKARQRIEQSVRLEMNSLPEPSPQEDFSAALQFPDGLPASAHQCSVRLVRSLPHGPRMSCTLRFGDRLSPRYGLAVHFCPCSAVISQSFCTRVRICRAGMMLCRCVHRQRWTQLHRFTLCGIHSSS
jgi:hypothetical protein